MDYNNNSNYQENSPIEGEEKRPSGLTALCILTFIGSGFMTLAYFFSFALYDMLPGQMLMLAETVGEPLAEVYENSANVFASIPRTSFLLIIIPYLLSITGAGIMLNMRKIGFHLYVIGQILVVGLPVLILNSDFSIGKLILALLFVALYTIFFKKMK